MVAFFWRNQLDPDDHVIPLLTAVGDVLGTGLLALVL
jgi:cation transporter-like permease